VSEQKSTCEQFVDYKSMEIIVLDNTPNRTQAVRLCLFCGH